MEHFTTVAREGSGKRKKNEGKFLFGKKNIVLIFILHIMNWSQI